MSAFQPSNIAKKKELSTEKKKLPHDIQENINLKILHYIVAEARPLITVESVPFINLLKEIDPRVEVFCVRTLNKLIAKFFFEFKENLKKEFGVASSVCLTTDLWGSNNIKKQKKNNNISPSHSIGDSFGNVVISSARWRAE